MRQKQMKILIQIVDTYPDPGNANGVSKSAHTNKRNKEQTKIATKKGKKSAEKLTAEDEVKMQETTNKKTMARNGRDKRTKRIRSGGYQSLIIDLDKRGQCQRSKRFPKHYRQVM